MAVSQLQNHKNKDTIIWFSSTSKDLEGKGCIFSIYMAYKKRYGNFLVKNGLFSILKVEGYRVPLILSNFAYKQNYNLISSTLKDLEIKCTYFQYIWLISWDMAVFTVRAQTSLNSLLCRLVGQLVSTQMSKQASSYLSGTRLF